MAPCNAAGQWLPDAEHEDFDHFEPYSYWDLPSAPEEIRPGWIRLEDGRVVKDDGGDYLVHKLSDMRCDYCGQPGNSEHLNRCVDGGRHA